MSSSNAVTSPVVSSAYYRFPYLCPVIPISVQRQQRDLSEKLTETTLTSRVGSRSSVYNNNCGYQHKEPVKEPVNVPGLGHEVQQILWRGYGLSYAHQQTCRI